MALCIEAPTDYLDPEATLFLAGGITGCPRWQAEVVRQLAVSSLVLLNPCRANFQGATEVEARAQIEWEFRHLRKATACLFWFPCETLCPIALFELGAWSMTQKPLFVGTHPAYQRRFDVIVQLQLVRPEIAVLEDLAKLVEQVKQWASASGILR
jgi:Nucleoside 2-deoxyribosyltransferase like